ncbi:MAG: hypothetical protein SGI74_01170 [Oligoflexia bacterium]|nr:hypothetical protein [Oligoflexia bacterium]
MVQKKKILKPKPVKMKSSSLTKEEMVNYIGTIFENLILGVNEVKSTLTKRIDDKTHRLEVLMEQIHSKIDTALEVSTSVLQHEVVVNNHEQRITHVETDLNTVKKVLKDNEV